MHDIELRPVEPDELPVVADLVRRAEAHDGVPRVLADDELVQEMEASYIDPADDTRVAVRGGEIVGWAYVWNPVAKARLESAHLQGEVAPAHRGTGVGRALLGWSLGRARQRLAGRTHGLPTFIRVGAYDWLEDRHRLYRRFGFEAVRWHEELIRPLTDLPAVEPPPGVALLSWPDDRDEELRQVRNGAFADHWGSFPVEPDVWHDFVRGHGSRPDLSVIAVEAGTGEVLGLCTNQVYPEDEAVTGRRDAWIANIATARAHRGRGIASSMIRWSLTAFADAGLDHAVLEVDADNPTGAARLYRSLGFEGIHRSTTYEIAVGTASADA